MSVVSENIGGPDAPDLREPSGPLLDNGLWPPVVLRYVLDRLDEECRFCHRPLVASQFVISVKGNYCLDCQRVTFKALGCGVAGLGKARVVYGPG
jgi:hypothetical protein